jgi:UDP:flavonoid glycosyltransferase YjiC (YdhE family)
MADVLFVTWDGGGNVPPAVEIAAELRGRGHGVRFVGHAGQRASLEAQGFDVAPTVHARAFHAAEPGSVLAMIAMFGDRGLGRDALAALDDQGADLVVVDCLLFGAMEELRRSGTPYVVLEHLYDAFFRGPFLRGPIGLGLRLRGLRVSASLKAARGSLVAAIPQLDPAGARPRPDVTYVGPVTEFSPRVAARPSGPWGRSGPAVLVSLSTFAYPGMGGWLQRILDATAGIDARVVVTTGPQLDPARLRSAGNHEVHRFVDHAELMPRVSLVVGHGGHGTTMKALAHQVPLVLMPMHPFVDQPMVAHSVEAAGAGRVVSKKASVEELRTAILAMLAEGQHRAAAARLGAAIRAMPGATNGADRIEALLRDGAGAPGHPSARP